jgi:hypothetical protein
MRKGILLALQGDTRLLTTLMSRALGPQAFPKKFGKLAMRTTDDLLRVSLTWSPRSWEQARSRSPRLRIFVG